MYKIKDEINLLNEQNNKKCLVHNMQTSCK